jgi:uncharacterized protein with HEPN domain
MPRDTAKLLYDIALAADRLVEFTAGKSQEQYQADDLLKSAVERQFEIVGEAMTRLRQLDPATVAKISESQRIIAFRNILIHGYAEVDDRLVWDIVRTKLPLLREEVSLLMTEQGQ